jgi:putative ABC transport system permease protein
MSIEGRPSGEARETFRLIVGPGYFDALGIRVLQGRDFNAADGALGREVAVVNARFIAAHFPDGTAVGQRIRLINRDPSAGTPVSATIVGVVQNVRQLPESDDGFEPLIYTPYVATPFPAATILARSDGGAAAVAAQIRELVGRLDPDLPLFDVMSVDDMLALDVSERGVFGSMLGIFAIIALTLAGVGLYGVMAYSVSQTTREIGIRIALGAHTKHVYWLVSRPASMQLAAGLMLGLIGSVGVGIVVQNLQSEVGPVDWVTFVSVVAILIVIALIACLIPARRATRLDPVAALRSE